MVEVHRVISIRFGQGSRKPTDRKKGRLPKAYADGCVLLGLTNKICPTVVYAESYRDFKRDIFVRFSVVLVL